VGHRAHNNEVDEGGRVNAEILPYVSSELSRSKLMYLGVEFQGIMCSGLKRRPMGLSSVRNFIVAGNPIPFEFSNGSVLTLSPENLSLFEATWIPFRFSFSNKEIK
jgi:hypothetical protein